MRAAVALMLLAACDSGSGGLPPVDGGAGEDEEGRIDAPPPEPFGELSGMCGVLTDAELTDASPHLVQGVFTFDREFMDPADRDRLTPGGVHLIETPNAGGSSEMSELFAFEQLARCEGALLVKTETEIVYTDIGGKKTDILVELDGHKTGVSVTRAFAFPIGQPYTEQQATMLLTRKLDDIQLSSANVTAADAWEKQILAYQAIDAQTASTVVGVWNGLDASLKADTILLIVTTDGADLFIYQN